MAAIVPKRPVPLVSTLSELEPADYLPEGPLTWLEELKETFDAEWRNRLAAAESEDRARVPPSTGDSRDRFEERQIGVACLGFLGDPGGHLESMVGEDSDSVVRAAANWGMTMSNSFERLQPKEGIALERPRPLKP